MENVNSSTGRPEVLKLESDLLKVEIAPALGGKIVSIFNKPLNKEFLWHNASLALAQSQPGADYDSNFWGGIDELLPNDIPETVDGIAYPDHGELWTARLDYTMQGQTISLSGLLPGSHLFYRKRISLAEDNPGIRLEYQIINQSGEQRRFLWKLHAALRVAKGDRLLSEATKAKVVYQDASRFNGIKEFNWPLIEGTDASVVPEKNNTMDFFYLYDTPIGETGLPSGEIGAARRETGISTGEMSLISGNGQYRFTYYYDRSVFPYQWYFASYGQFRDHYTAILEPASAMPVSVNEAAALGQCTVLAAGREINTVVTIYAGENKELSDNFIS